MDDDSSSMEDEGRNRYTLKSTTTTTTISNYTTGSDDGTVMEEGQEMMLIEELQQKMTMVEEDGDVHLDIDAEQQEPQKPTEASPTHKHENKKSTKKSRRKVQQVLLVPTSGDLLIERYRQASRRSKKARALLDQALNWRATVANRDKVAAEAFNEAGKARLLVEQAKNKTLSPELIALLTDAKNKGEEEVFRAVDYKITQLVPNVKLPSNAAVAAAFHKNNKLYGRGKSNLSSRKGSRLSLFRPPGLDTMQDIDDDKTATASEMMSKDPAFQCFQEIFDPHASNLGGDIDHYSTFYDDEDDDDGDDDDEAEEHMFRAKQYLEFILPDLGDAPDDDSMAPKASSRSVLQSFHESDDGSSSKLGDISTLGFDESRSFDNLSSKYSSVNNNKSDDEDEEDLFSMSSLNDILDAPVEDFVPEKIMSMPSMKRKKLCIKMSFGSKSFRTTSNVSDGEGVGDGDDDEQDGSNSLVATPVSNADDIGEEENRQKEVRSMPSSEVGGTPVATKKEKRFKPLNFVMKLNTVVHNHQQQHEDDQKTHSSGGFLRRFKTAKKKPKKIPDATTSNSDAEDMNLHIIAPVLSDLSDAQSRRSPTAVDETSKEECSETPKAGEASEALTPIDKDTTDVDQEDENAAGDVPLQEDMQLPPSQSLDSINQDDRYLIDNDDDDDDNKAALSEATDSLVPPITPVSVVSIKNAHSRYSPIHSSENDDMIEDPSSDDEPSRYTVMENHREDNDPKETPKSIIPIPINTPKSAIDAINDNAINTKENALKHEDAGLNDIMNLEVSSPNVENDAASLATNYTSGGSKNRKKRRSLLGIFHRKDGGTDIASISAQETTPSKLPPKAQKQSSLQQSLHQASMKNNKKMEQKVPSSHSSQASVTSLLAHMQAASGTTDAYDSDTGEIVKEPPMLSQTVSTGNAAGKNSSLKTALQLTHTKVEVSTTAFESKSATKSSSPSVVNGKKKRQKRELPQQKSSKSNLKSNADAKSKKSAKGKAGKQSKNGKPPKGTPVKSGRTKTRTPSKAERTKPKKQNDSDQSLSSKTSKGSKSIKSKKAAIAQTTNASGLQATRWVNNLVFPKNRKQASPAPADKEVKTISKRETAEVQVKTSLAAALKKESTRLSPSTVPEQQAAETPTANVSSLMANPLLPFQLMKHLEEQAKIREDDGAGAKQAAEKSIMQAMSRTIESESPRVNKEDSAASCDEKENGSLAELLSPGTVCSSRSKILIPPSPFTRGGGGGASTSILRESPRMLALQNARSGTATSCSNLEKNPELTIRHHRPDADGLNARTKDVREVLGLPQADTFGDERSRSYLSRITESTYRQDFDLPDP